MSQLLFLTLKVATCHDYGFRESAAPFQPPETAGTHDKHMWENTNSPDISALGKCRQDDQQQPGVSETLAPPTSPQNNLLDPSSKV